MDKFELTPSAQELSGLMGMRDAITAAFPESTLQQVQTILPDLTTEALTMFLDNYFGYGTPQLALGAALEGLSYDCTRLQVACFLLKKSIATETAQVLAARYRVPHDEIRKVLSTAVGLLLTDEQHEMLTIGLVIGSCAALGISLDTPEVPKNPSE